MTPDHDPTRTADPPTVTKDPAAAIRDLLTDTGVTAAAPLNPPSAIDAPPGIVIEREIGMGGMGVVYLARQLGLNRLVALKLVKPSEKVDTKALIRFLAEAEAVAAVKHPNVVEVFQYGDHNGRPYLALEYCPGGDLTSLLRCDMQGSEPKDATWFRKVADLMAKVADGVNAAHLLGIVHRDLKPHNVFLAADGTPKVADFGLAKRGLGSDLTNTDAVMGTPAYMSPEQAGGGTKFVGPEADVWALGVMLYELCGGERPIDTSGPLLDAIARVARAEVSLLRTNAPAVPPDLALIAHKCLSADPRDRYPTAGVLANDLRNWLDGKPISARPTGVVEQAVKWAKRKPTLAGLYAAGLFGVVLAGVAVGLTVLWQEAKSAHSNADAAREEAVNARAGEEEARMLAETAREKLAAVEYGRTIQVAYQECLNGNVGGALTLLEGTRPDLRGWEWRYVHKLCNGQSLTLNAHAGAVSSVMWSPDGGRVLTGGADATARIWDVRTGHELISLKGHTQQIHSATFSPDGTKVLTATVHMLGDTRQADATARVWDAATGKEIAVLSGHKGQTVTASFSPDGTKVLTGDIGKAACIWDAVTGTKLQILGGEEDAFARVEVNRGEIVVARWSPDGARAAGVQNGKVMLWDASSGDVVRILDDEEHVADSIVFSSDGAKLVTTGNGPRGSGYATVVWDTVTGKALRRFPGRNGNSGYSWPVKPLSPDGARLVVCSPDGTARVWDVATGTEVAALKGRKSFSASFSPDGSRIVTTELDTQIARVWDAVTGDELASLSGHTGSVSYPQFSPDGTRVVTRASDGTARIWNVPPRTSSPPAEALNWATGAADWTPDGLRNLSPTANGKSVVTDSRTKKSVVLEEVENTRGRYFSPDGRLIIGARVQRGGPRLNPDEPKGLPLTVVWDAATGKKLCAVEGHNMPWPVNQDGTRILTTLDDGTARIWDIGGREVAVLRGPTRRIQRAWWSPDGSRILTYVGPPRTTFPRGDDDARPAGGLGPPETPPGVEEPNRIWDASTGRQIATFTGKLQGVNHSMVTWSPDGTKLAVRGELLDKSFFDYSPDGSRNVVRVLDAATGTELWSAPATIGSGGVAWSPGGAHILFPRENTIRVCDATTGAEVRSLVGHTGFPHSASFSPDGSRIVTTADDNTARLWDARTGAEVLSLKRPASSSSEPAGWSADGVQFVLRKRTTLSGGGLGVPTPEVWDATPTDPRFRTPVPDKPKR